MSDIELEKHDEITILRLNQGTTNPLNLEFIQEISKNMELLKNDPNVRGVVITSGNDKFLSIGFDLPILFKQNKNEVKTFYKTFNRLCLEIYTFPKPTIAALTGHAIAGGCILTLCFDYRFIAEGRKLMGLNEIKLGLAVPYPADRILYQLVGSRTANEIVSTGDFYPSEKLLEMGMVDLVMPIEHVLDKSIEKAKLLGAMPTEAYKMIKQNRVESVKAQILEQLEKKEELFLERWFEPETRKLLEEAIKKF
jgi:enoyl-CoA hydratase/carnithine racemase